jgi:4a-hydroxytetrahydrobiopterin dehydratase
LIHDVFVHDSTLPGTDGTVQEKIKGTNLFIRVAVRLYPFCMSRTPFTPEDLKKALTALPGWQEAKGGKAIAREFSFKDFSAAFAFMTRAALKAEKLNHHPDWANVYNKVSVTLNTHDAGGVTELDIQLAMAMDKYAQSI